ncbi:hypothetical protein QFZ82_004311 [Streptomyces sp. V4I23]|uniref:hypothetical protein n=1 Tax=Streptomyces sp. V4I23 TaxID=3042282 RepID=UPI002783079E|nr:hypothetical protein [Streptomyces sp. V4I23]MDQ1009826.1 hypothetical protein [Streptomyces sp. V4I23]
MLIGRDRRHRVVVTASLLLGLLGTLLGCVAALSTEAAAPHAGSNRGAVAAGKGSARGAVVAPVAGTGVAAVTGAGADIARGGAAGVRTGAGSAPGEAVLAGAAKPPGCGERTGAGDSGAHPGVPPRGGSAYELLPALPQTHGSGGVALVCDQTALDVSPLRGPPPLAPPSAVDLSVLRV